jgi:glycosidase
MDWAEIGRDLNNPDSFPARVNRKLKKMISVRRQSKVFGRGSIEFLHTDERLLAFRREYGNEKWIFVHNLSETELPWTPEGGTEMFGQPVQGVIEGRGFRWIRLMD